LVNPQPTVIEIYADWCHCQSLGADNLALQKQYAGKINFVMLNVDNNNWLPKVDRFSVDGITHFLFWEMTTRFQALRSGRFPVIF
jgi:thioredoxin-like negative regulator of GroEL